MVDKLTKMNIVSGANKIGPLPPISSVSGRTMLPSAPPNLPVISAIPALPLYDSVRQNPLTPLDPHAKQHNFNYNKTPLPTERSDLVPVSKVKLKVIIKLVLIMMSLLAVIGLIGLTVALGIVYSNESNTTINNSNLTITTTTISSLQYISTPFPISVCKHGEYMCTNGECIPQSYVCDVFWDCQGGDDEIGCDCSSLFACPDGSCIFNSWVCDMTNDCGDYTDELGCDCPGASCVSNGVCIRESQVCDNVINCVDASDEINCTCSDLEYTCTDGTCVLISLWCDGVKDCPNREDESKEACGSVCQSSNAFECADHVSCIDITQRCDGIPQCEDKSDEVNCIGLDLGTGVLFSTVSGTYVPVCSAVWNTALDDTVCTQLGYGSSVSSSSQVAENSDGFAVLIDPTATLLSFQYSSTCSSGQVITLSCQHNACGSRAKQFESSVAKILHGTSAQPGYWPWQVSLQYYGDHICGGSLLTPIWILTAAHCLEFDPNRPGRFTVRLGTTKASEPDSTMIEVAVKTIHMHPDYNTLMLQNDIALIELTTPVSYTSYIRPICIGSNTEEFTECYTTGWGAVDPKAENYPENLQEARMVLINDTECQADPDIAKWGIYEDIMLCAGYAHGLTTVCKGDSGGPLVCRKPGTSIWELVGIVSWGPVADDVKCMGISVFTEVQAYQFWLYSYL